MSRFMNCALSVASLLQWRTGVRAGLTALFFTISACSLGDRPQIETYTLNSTTTAPQSCNSKLALQIIEPTAVPGLDSIRIPIIEGEQRINYYTGVRWAAPVPEMLQTVLVGSFEKSNSFASIFTESEAARADMQLTTDIRNFEVTDTKTGAVRIRLVAKLIRNKDHKLLATIPVEKTATPTAYKTENIVATFNSASAEAASEIVASSIKILPGCKGK